MTVHEPSETSQGRFSPMNLGVLAFLVLLNLGIVAYAIYRTAPAAAEVVSAPPAVAPGGEPGAAGGTAASSAPQQPAETVTQADLPSQEQVQEIWIAHCAACHGLDGRGAGPAADQLYPKPRDFIESPLRFASTGGGSHQVIAALERTIGSGVPRSAMPGFHGVLTESEIAGLARHVYKLRQAAGQDGAATEPLDLGPRPPITPELEARGKSLFHQLACTSCHGEAGRGDGTAARGLRDSQGKPVLPADLASGLFKSGQNLESLARTILKGVPGTPMTPYEMALIKTTNEGRRDATDVWALVAYIQTFSTQKSDIGEASGGTLVLHRLASETPLADPAAIEWLGIDPLDVALRPLWQRSEDTHHLTVRAARGERTIALCFDWRDETLDLARDFGEWPDGVAVMFAPGGEVPALPMGVSVPGHEPKAPVDIWYWKADRQYAAAVGAAAGGFEFAAVDPGATIVFAPQSASIPAALPVAGGMNYDGLSEAPLFRTAEAAGNVPALPALATRPALEATALGFGTLATAPADEQDLAASAVWASGHWRVLVSRPLHSRGKDDVIFEPGQRIAVAFAVWNGSKGDRAGVKLITGWHWLVPNAAGDGS